MSTDPNAPIVTLAQKMSLAQNRDLLVNMSQDQLAAYITEIRTLIAQPVTLCSTINSESKPAVLKKKAFLDSI